MELKMTADKMDSDVLKKLLVSVLRVTPKLVNNDVVIDEDTVVVVDSYLNDSAFLIWLFEGIL